MVVAAGMSSAAPKDRVYPAARTTRGIYLDCNASAPLDPRVAEVMVSALTKGGNASSAHGFGRRQAALVGDAREQVAALVGGRASNVVFTASATEANNLALFGTVQEANRGRRRILVFRRRARVGFPDGRLAQFSWRFAGRCHPGDRRRVC